MTDIEVREAEDTDVEQAREVLRVAYAEYESQFPSENWQRYITDILDLEGRATESVLLVAEHDHRVVGCVSYFPPGSKASYPSDAFSERWPQDWAAFRLLGVAPDARGLGVGKTLTNACVDKARAAGAPALGLHTTLPMATARAMYERMGFVREPRFDFQPGPTVLVEAYRLTL